MSARKPQLDSPTLAEGSNDLALVRRALEGLRYGECIIAVHDGVIVQVSRTEKIRPQKARP